MEPTKQQALWPYVSNLRQGVLANAAAMKPKAVRLLLTEAIYALDHIEQQIKDQAERNQEK